MLASRWCDRLSKGYRTWLVPCASFFPVPFTTSHPAAMNKRPFSRVVGIGKNFWNISKLRHKGYKNFVLQLVDQEYESPLKDVLGSAVLGSREFVDFVKEKFISDQKPERGVPAIRQLANKISIHAVAEAVNSELSGNPLLARKIKIFLCRKLTAESLKTIGAQFGIGDSAVSQSYSRFLSEIETNRRLRRQVIKIEKTIM